MNLQSVLSELNQFGVSIAWDEPMQHHTSFRIGGPVRAMLFPVGEDQLIHTVRQLEQIGCTPLLIGNGSNLLAADGPIDRVVIKTHDGLSGCEQVDDHTIYAASGTLLSRVAVFAQSLGLAGLEFAHGIPGTLGGALVMNAGAYGGEMAQVTAEVRYLDDSRTQQTVSGADLTFSYRHSRFSGTDDVILGATLILSPGDPVVIQAKMEELAQKRRTSQPLNLPSAGSIFKRPTGGYAAALIDQAGLRGFAMGGAQVSEKHAGFVVNRGDATCDDVRRLMAHVQETVLRQSGIALEPEVQMIT
ncbi:MAG: UDP-N-acetylmuramate dehydrogenase [Oscillospiraceae bacterium]|nr:UDP-N-acetylmuramate dehydrogenase [Oscillospiraceae bacterium]